MFIIDTMVLATQNWLNKTYGGDSRYNIINENGKTGWATIYALIRALQIELGIQTTTDNFGPTTQSLYKPLKRTDGTCANQFYLLQGALWCKGYNTGHYGTKLDGKYYIDGSFDESVEKAVKQLEMDAGRATQKGVVDLNLMMALLSMDAFMEVRGGDSKIREIQQYLNRNYENYIRLKPCDGIYGRETNTALIYAIQAEEGLPADTANGNFGPTTKNCCPTIPYQNVEKSYTGATYNNINKFITLAQMGLYVNGFKSSDFNGNYDDTIKAIKDFQKLYAISVTGIVNLGTWLSIFTSCGDIDRPAIACDCATIITNDNINVLKNNNYKYIGRYLSGYAAGKIPKGLSTEELQILFNNGIRLFPIQQGSANTASYFNEKNAQMDAESANKYAESLHLQFGSIIYFAVDFDVLDYQITSNVIPYFKELYSTFMNLCFGKYRIGIYGTRNVCNRVCEAGYACSSFVGDMSTGFSGNLGFSIPNNWALDQFNETKISSGGKSIAIDKDGFSGNYLGISQEYSVAESSLNDLNKIEYSFIFVNRSGVSIPVYESKEHINWPLPQTGTQYGISGKKIGEIKVNDFYIFFGVTNPAYDTVHRVLFNDGTDVRMGYIDGEHVYPSITDTDVNISNYNQMPKYNEPYSCLRYLPEKNDYELVSSEHNQEINIMKSVIYFNIDGKYEGTLNKGDKIVINSGNVNKTGDSRPWCYLVNKIKFKNGREELNKYVSTGLEYASAGSERAWY